MRLDDWTIVLGILAVVLLTCIAMVINASRHHHRLRRLCRRSDELLLAQQNRITQLINQSLKRAQYQVRCEMIDALRAAEGSQVTISCDNPEGEGPDNCCIGVIDDWTDWENVDFRGPTVGACLRDAMAAREQIRAERREKP